MFRLHLSSNFKTITKKSLQSCFVFRWGRRGPVFCLHLESVLVSLLDDGELGVRRFGFEHLVWRVFGAVQDQRPLLEPATLWLLRVEAHLEDPLALRVFAPRMSCHEWPLRESISSVVVVGSSTQNHRPVEAFDRLFTSRRRKFQTKLTWCPSVKSKTSPGRRGGSRWL